MSDRRKQGRGRATDEAKAPVPGDTSPASEPSAPAEPSPADALPRSEASAGEPPPVGEPAGEAPPAPDQLPHSEAPASEPAPSEPGGDYRALALGLAGALVLVVALVAAAPFWAPLLPWGDARPGDNAAILGRIERLEAAQEAGRHQLDLRVAALEARPAPAEPDLGDVRQRIDTLAAETSDLARRVAGLDTALRAQPASDVADKLEALERALGAQATASTAFAERLDALDAALQARVAGDTTDRALVLALLQIRSAIQVGRPFAAEYEAFAALAQAHPAIAAAAAPLAEPAKTGVASRAVLLGRLRELAGTIAGATPPGRPDPELGWTDRALEQLRGLVTIRRVDEAGQSAETAAVSQAERALAGGDLEAAIAALGNLAGAPADAASPWLRMARERLAVDRALQRTETLLTAGLGGAIPEAGSPG
jgi:hypothetical protein